MNKWRKDCQNDRSGKGAWHQALRGPKGSWPHCQNKCELPLAPRREGPLSPGGGNLGQCARLYFQACTMFSFSLRKFVHCSIAIRKYKSATQQTFNGYSTAG